MSLLAPSYGQTADASRYLVTAAVPRFALVVGVEHYWSLPDVPNALNDAAGVAEVLKRADFPPARIRYLADPTDAELSDYVEELGHRTSSGPATLVFFFAGHGFQSDGLNFVVPANAKETEGVPVINILGTLATEQPSLSILFIDACRTIDASGVPTGPPAQAKTVGFADVAVGEGAVLGLASQFGAPARSVMTQGGHSSQHSPYTAGLIEYIPQPGLSLPQMFDEVRAFVKGATEGTQRPQEITGGSTSTFYFLPGQAERDTERRLWCRALQSGRADRVRQYIETHPSSQYLKAALEWLRNPPPGSPSEPAGTCQE